AASCSGIQQPNDVGPTFKNMKRALTRGTYEDQVDLQLIKTLECKLGDEKGLTKGIRTKISAFVKRVQPALSSVFVRPNILKGFSSSGVFPFSVDRILSQIPNFSKYTAEQELDLKDAITKISNQHLGEKVTQATMDKFRVF